MQDYSTESDISLDDAVVNDYYCGYCEEEWSEICWDEEESCCLTCGRLTSPCNSVSATEALPDVEQL